MQAHTPAHTLKMDVFLLHFHEAHTPAHTQNTLNLAKYFVYRRDPAHIPAHTSKTFILVYIYIRRTPWRISKIENLEAGGDEIHRAGWGGAGGEKIIFFKN